MIEEIEADGAIGDLLDQLCQRNEDLQAEKLALCDANDALAAENIRLRKESDRLRTEALFSSRSQT